MDYCQKFAKNLSMHTGDTAETNPNNGILRICRHGVTLTFNLSDCKN